jgi:hypothetical protein
MTSRLRPLARCPAQLAQVLHQRQGCSQQLVLVLQVALAWQVLQQWVVLAARCSRGGRLRGSSSSRQQLGCMQARTPLALMRRSTVTNSSRSQSSRRSRRLWASRRVLLALVLLLEGPWAGLGPRRQQEVPLLLLVVVRRMQPS